MIRTLIIEDDFRVAEINAAYVAKDPDFEVIGVAFTAATYDRSSQRFANIRAARDAEIRDAKALADQIRTRVAAAPDMARFRAQVALRAQLLQ